MSGSLGGIKVRPIGITGKGLREGTIYTLKEAPSKPASWVPNATAIRLYDFIPRGGFKSSARFDEYQVDAWLRTGEWGNNGLERVKAKGNPSQYDKVKALAERGGTVHERAAAARILAGMKSPAQSARQMLDEARAQRAHAYTRNASILRSLQEGDKVEVVFAPRSSTSPDEKRTLTVTGRHEATYLNVYVTSGRVMRGNFSGGSISDYGDAIYYQPTMQQAVREVRMLKKIGGALALPNPSAHWGSRQAPLGGWLGWVTHGSVLTLQGPDNQEQRGYGTQTEALHAARLAWRRISSRKGRKPGYGIGGRHDSPMGRRYNPKEVHLTDAALKQRLFIGVYPSGLVYADRGRELHGDYARLGFLPYDTLKLELSPGSEPFAKLIRADAASLQAKRGQQYQIGGPGQTVLLGHVAKRYNPKKNPAAADLEREAKKLDRLADSVTLELSPTHGQVLLYRKEAADYRRRAKMLAYKKNPYEKVGSRTPKRASMKAIGSGKYDKLRHALDGVRTWAFAVVAAEGQGRSPTRAQATLEQFKDIARREGAKEGEITAAEHAGYAQRTR